MTIDELIQAASARGWVGGLRVPGRRGLDRGDNLYVVDRDAEGWYVAFLERGELSVLQRYAHEAEAATATYRYLRRAYEGTLPTGPSVAPAAEPATDASGAGWITWTLGKDD
jgi:hypothetical protein